MRYYELRIALCASLNDPGVRPDKSAALTHLASNPAVSCAPSDHEAPGGTSRVPPASSSPSARPLAAENWSDESHAHAYQGLRTESGRERTVREPARR